MAKIISIVNSKGGVGKTSIAVNLSVALSLKKKKVNLIDADPQGSLSRWVSVRKQRNQGNEFLQLFDQPFPSDKLHIYLPKHLTDFDFIIIDCAPNDDDVMRSALAVCDVALIPVSPSPLDIWTVEKAIEMINKRNSLKGSKIKGCLLISKRIMGTVLGNDVREGIKKFKLPVLKTEIFQRIALCESLILGQGVLEYQQNSISSKEFQNLAKEIEKI